MTSTEHAFDRACIRACIRASTLPPSSSSAIKHQNMHTRECACEQEGMYLHLCCCLLVLEIAFHDDVSTKHDFTHLCRVKSGTRASAHMNTKHLTLAFLDPFWMHALGIATHNAHKQTRTEIHTRTGIEHMHGNNSKQTICPSLVS